MQNKVDSKSDEIANENLEELVIPEIDAKPLSKEDAQMLLEEAKLESELQSHFTEPDAYDEEGNPLYSDFRDEIDTRH
ncbi:hypothetical protein LS70_001160 [Helicobacter sp. MIT 11-5569]|uniref:hypothetical protein n=1 Tax=Helicobacter sp. MIT 11-5569 TaxID=1548151 RepID=UPI00051FB5F8|nr:hypothetical protein [Helicobacter sp. MIT 11-5569]TLD85188.1 hypothetical protein LS70_001160 [Helicobacter sp. MIT 11-5569]